VRPQHDHVDALRTQYMPGRGKVLLVSHLRGCTCSIRAGPLRHAGQTQSQLP
jgi:hypothetical protein